MAYQFTNQKVASSKIKDTEAAEFTLKGINGTTNDASMVREGLTLMLGIVGWTIADANRIVTQDIEETT